MAQRHRPGVRVRRLAAAAAALVAASAMAVIPLGVGGAGATTPALQSINVANYSNVLADDAGFTLYLLTTEANAKLHCTGSCLTDWSPLTVASTRTSVPVGAGVKGKIGFVKRTSSTKQITFNGYPIYIYNLDGKKGQENGEGKTTGSGTWMMVRASATTAPATLVKPLLQSDNAGSFKNVLVSTVNRSLYLLTSEKGAKTSFHCTGGCLASWFPLTVAKGTTQIPTGPGVKGAVGFVKRGSSLQVTFNSYPVYTYVGDSSPGQTNGEGIAADGGTWYLVSAGAKSASSTPVT